MKKGTKVALGAVGVTAVVGTAVFTANALTNVFANAVIGGVKKALGELTEEDLEEIANLQEGDSISFTRNDKGEFIRTHLYHDEDGDEYTSTR